MRNYHPSLDQARRRIKALGSLVPSDPVQSSEFFNRVGVKRLTMVKLSEIIATLLVIAAAICLSTKHPVEGFVLFTLSNFFFTHVGVVNKLWWLVLSQSVLVISNVYGILNYV